MTGFVGQLLNMLLAFITRTVFIYTLSELYLGINGLFGSLLTMLSLTELGIGTAITYALYKPLAQDDRDMIKALTDFYKRAYQIIGFAVLLIGSVALKRRSEAELGFLTLAAIGVNVGLVALTIFGQSRYTIYNMPCFYAALWLMLRGCLCSLRQRRGAR